jgi:hypothetical protein
MTAKLELKTASGGKVILDPTDTAVDQTLTLPAVAGTVLNDQSNIEAQVKTATNASGSAPIYACRAWVNFNGTGTVAIRASGNVSSITDEGTGDYTVNFTTALPDANYAISVAAKEDTAAGGQNMQSSPRRVADTTTTTRVSVTLGTSYTPNDAQFVYVSVFR